MRSISTVMVCVVVLAASTVCAQFVPGSNGGRGRGGGGGLYGVTRRTYMGAPNMVAARYFQASGLPLVNPQNLNTFDPAGGAPLAANRPGTVVPRPGQPLRPTAVLAQPSKPPAGPPSSTPPVPTGHGLARVGR